MRKTAWIVSFGLAGVLVIAALVYYLGSWNLHVPFVSDTCRAFSDDTTVKLKPEQMDNAATIVAVGARENMPPYGVTVALATAFQESKLQNLSGGDRDSVGLFQQRPSQGWGTVEELNTPRIAAARFYAGLARVEGWQEMSVTDAAQAVQRSAYPRAYAKHETKSRALASALLGYEGAAVTCILRQSEDRTGGAESIEEELLADRNIASTPTDGSSVHTTVSEDQIGWQIAGWYVANSHAHGITKVQFKGSEWSAESGEWESVDDASSQVVRATVG